MCMNVDECASTHMHSQTSAYVNTLIFRYKDVMPVVNILMLKLHNTVS